MHIFSIQRISIYLSIYTFPIYFLYLKKWLHVVFECDLLLLHGLLQLKHRQLLALE